MTRIIIVIAGLTVGIHGLIHLMGTVVYMRFAAIEGLAYKTSLFDGKLELGERGMSLFGAAFALPALGFVAGALSIIAGWNSWQPILLISALLSLALTILDWDVAFRGGIVDMTIILFLVGRYFYES